MSTLSAKFAKLKNAPAANNGGGRARVQQNIASQQAKRNAQSQARRTGNAPQQGNKGKAGTGSRKGGKPIVSGVKRNLRKNGKGRNAKKGAKGGEKKAKVTSSDLDMDMDRYWHAAGKGPDPVVASLDREMDEYHNKGKNAQPATAAATEMAE